MQRQKFIVKFFPEIMIKGSKAKKQMIEQLNGNLQKLLFKISKDITIKKSFDKIEIEAPIEVCNEVREKLINCTGVEQVLEAKQYDNIHTIDDIKDVVNSCVGHLIVNKSFVLRAKRSGNHSFKSPQIEREVGGFLLFSNPTSKVNLHNPEVTVNIELNNTQLDIIFNKYQGLGGYPLGTQGEILSLMSGGFDSTVASYLMLKRGVQTHFIFFNLGGVAHEIGVKQVAYYLWQKYGSSYKAKFISVPFDDVVTEIFNSTSQSYMGVQLKRLMLIASEQIAKSMNIDALLTGESIAQVSSQTLRNLALINSATSMLVLRPLSTVNKPEIIEIATKIGTKKFAESMPEYCGVISQNPVTHGSYDRMEKEASKFNYDVLNSAVQNATIIDIENIQNDIENIGQIEIISNPIEEKHTIIDIRQGVNNKEISTNCEVLKIPFYNLKSEFKKLPQNKEYLFYCDKGILSQLHGQFLKDELKCENIKVYRPI